MRTAFVFLTVLMLVVAPVTASVASRQTGNPMYLRFCEGDSHTLSCPYFATKINILYANYGRLTGADVCGWGGGNKNCRAAGALAKVQARCQGLSRCTLLATNSEFGDPCRATYKYLEIRYVCE